MLAIRANGLPVASRSLKNARSTGLRPYARRTSLEQPRSNYLESAVVKANTRPARRTELTELNVNNYQVKTNGYVVIFNEICIF